MNQARKKLEAEVGDLKDRLEGEKTAKNAESGKNINVSRFLFFKYMQRHVVGSKSSFKNYRFPRLHQHQCMEVISSEALPSVAQPFLDLNQAVESYKAKAESYLAKMEEAEIARAKVARQETLSEYHIPVRYLALSDFPSSSCSKRHGKAT